MRLRRLRWGLVGAIGCAVAMPAQGRDPDKPSDEQLADEAERQANRAVQEGRMEEAAEDLRKAWGFYKDPRLVCNLGTIEVKMSRHQDGAQSLSTCLRSIKRGDMKVLLPGYKRMLDEARAHVGELTVEANVPDAEVFVDGKGSGKLPLLDPIFLDPGSHVVEVKAPGYQPEVRLAVMTAGRHLIVRVRLEPMRVDVAPAPPDGAPNEPEPKEEAKSPVPAPLPVIPAPSAKAPARVSMPKAGAEPAREPVRAAVILGGFGLGLAGVGVGVAGLMAAGAARDEAKALTQAPTPNSNQCPGDTSDPCWAVYNAMDKAVGLTALGIAGITVAALGGSLVVYELVRSAPEGRTAGARVTVMAAPGGGALQVTGSF